MVGMKSVEAMQREERAYSLLRKALWVTLSTVDAREDAPLGVGSPYAVPITVVEHEQKFYFHCSLTGQKTENLRQDNRICLTCVGKADVVEPSLSIAYESALFFATAEEVTSETKKKEVLFALCRRYAPSQDVQSQIEALVDKTGIWVLQMVDCSLKQRKFE